MIDFLMSLNFLGVRLDYCFIPEFQFLSTPFSVLLDNLLHTIQEGSTNQQKAMMLSVL